MEFDVVIVGGGPSGLSAAIRIAQRAKQDGEEISICLVEKGSEIGAHILSGAVLEPTALNELIPDWKERGAPLNNPVTADEVYYLVNDTNRIKVPPMMVPSATHNDGNYALSLGNLCRWLGEQAEKLEINLFPGFAASEVLYAEDGSVRGIATTDMGISESGEKKPVFEAGYELLAKYTIFAEGCRGHLGKSLIKKFNLDDESGTQHYGIGIKEIWDIDPDKHHPGKVIHTVGWPLTHLPGAGGGSFMYHMENNQVALGLIVDLSYSNPHLSPFDEFQKLKHHPIYAQFLEGGTRVAYGARAIIKGGLQALPKTIVPGGLLVGDDAGFLNVLKIKGNHTAMKSGMLAADSVYEALKAGSEGGEELTSYPDKVKKSWLYEELHRSRNIGPALHKFGILLGSSFAVMDQAVFKGKLPFTFNDPKPDHATLKLASKSKKIDYPKPDGALSFDKLSSVFLSSTNHEEDQPCHLQLSDPTIPLTKNLPDFDEPAQRYCPAGVYEFVEDDGEKRFQINSQNCVHCKTCDIKDPAQNINWVVPEGAGGPNYPNM
ncbi:MAG: electron transfer flavoprotein-ubiquinone oxidoreductase [Pseudomonadales bacterium]|nr:electron transfer flavoprotein-ubiquinone oxidoreductase [Pseudomonadales bacterium]